MVNDEREYVEQLREQVQLGGRLKFLKDQDSAFRTMLKYLDLCTQSNYQKLVVDEEKRSKQVNFEPDDALKGRIRMVSDLMEWMRTKIHEAETAQKELLDMEDSGEA